MSYTIKTNLDFNRFHESSERQRWMADREAVVTIRQMGECLTVMSYNYDCTSLTCKMETTEAFAWRYEWTFEDEMLALEFKLAFADLLVEDC